VHESGEAVSRVSLHPLPHVQHRAAGRIDEDAIQLAKSLERVDRDSECREDDDVRRFHGREIELTLGVGIQEGHAHRFELRVHQRIVDDLADEEDPAIRELPAGLVGIFHGPVHAVAEAETPGQPESGAPDFEPVIGTLHRLDDGAAVFPLQNGLHLGLETEAASKIVAVVAHGRSS